MNDVEENLRYGILTEGSYDVDLGRKIGAIAKRYGIVGQFDSPGTEPVDSIYSYKKSSGDKLMLQKGGILYSVSAAGDTITIDDSTDFLTFDWKNVNIDLSDGMYIENDGYSTIAFQHSVIDTYRNFLNVSSSNPVGQDFTLTTGCNIFRFDVEQYDEPFWPTPVEYAQLTLKVYESSAKVTEYYSRVCEVQEGHTGNFKFDDSVVTGRPVFLDAGSYYFEITSSSAEDISIKTGLYDAPTYVETDGNMYNNGVEGTNGTLIFTLNAYNELYKSGTLERTFDLGYTPMSAKINWTDDVSDGGSVVCTAYGSSDGKTFGSAYTVAKEGALPNSRYIKLIFTLNSDVTRVYTPFLSEIVLSYSSNYDTATQVTADIFKEDATYAEFADNLYVAGGTTPVRYTGTEAGTSGCYVGFVSPYAPSAPTVAEGSATGITGTYKYKITFVNDWGAESNPSDASTEVTVTDKKVSLSDISVEGTTRYAGHRAVRRNVYRTKNLTETGTNLWDSAIEPGAINTTTGADAADASRRRTADYIEIDDPTLRYFSSADGMVQVGMLWFFYDDTCAYLGYSVSWKEALTPPATTKYIRFVMRYNAAANAWPADPTNLFLGISGDSETYYFVDTIADNTTTTYTDDTPDTDLIIPMEEDNYPPHKSSIVYEHKNYMFYVDSAQETGYDKSKLWFSKVGIPDSVPLTNYKQFPGPIKGVSSYADALIVGGDNFTYAIRGSIFGGSADDTVIRELSSTEGPVSHNAMQRCYSQDGDILVIATRFGLRYLTPGLQENSLHTNTISYPIQPMMDKITDRPSMVATFFRDRYYLALSYLTHVNSIIMVYDFRTNSWNPPWRIAASSFAVVDNKLYIGSHEDSQIYLMEEPRMGTEDDEDTYAIARLASTFAGYPHIKKKFSQFRMALDEGTITDMYFLASVDNGDEVTLNMATNWSYSTTPVSPRKSLYLPRGYNFQLTIADYSRDDWIISRIILEYERGEL